MKTTVLIPFLGKRPRDFEHFAHSASFVDAEFVFLSDDARSAPSYPNFRVVPFSLSEFNDLARKAIGCGIASSNVAKICDFRPAFGLIFSHLLRDSDYWGYCDVDVLFGNVSTYLQRDYLSRYDVLSLNANYLSGSFTLWRNAADVNHMFEHSSQWKTLMASPQLHAFDECGFGLWGRLNAGESIFDIPVEFQSMTHVVKTLERDGRIRAHFRGLVKEVFSDGEVLQWTPGHVSTVGRPDDSEYAYFHSVLLKNLPTFYVPAWNPMPAEIFISRSGYHRTLASAVSKSAQVRRVVQRKLRNLPGGLMRRIKAVTRSS